jgi:phospholipase C
MSLGEIEHIVVLMLENRSFDCLLGTLYPPSPRFNGLPPGSFNTDLMGNRIPAWSHPGLSNAEMTIPAPDPGELFEDMNMQLFNGQPAAGMSGFAQNYQVQPDQPPYDPRNVMHHYEDHQVPVIRTLARHFAVCDSWHASAPCQTWPNRFFTHTGTAGGYVNNSPTHFPYLMPTVFGQLGDAGQSWRVYFHDIPQALTLEELWWHPFHFRHIDDFKKHARKGTLPAYSFIEPRYFALLSSLPNDQHPPHNVTLGEQLIAEVYNAVRQGPGWHKTLLIITYDEHGGLYDHVSPPAAKPPSPPQPGQFAFDRYGVRVPAVLVSPYIEPGTILRPSGDYPFDHTSIIATLRERFFPRAEPLTERVRFAPPVGPVLTLPTPSNDGPASVHALPYEPSGEEIKRAKRAPANHHQRALREAPLKIKLMMWAVRACARIVSLF